VKKSISILKKISIPIAILALGMLYFNLNPKSFAYFPKCPFYSFTGLYCPGCGSQRAFHEMLHGNLWVGIQHNFLIILALLVIFYKFYVFFQSRFQKENTVKNILYHNAAPWVILGVVVSFWILRNIPMDPFIILAP
jgi:predicted ABC-type sugar transport system permease subunit